MAFTLVQAGGNLYSMSDTGAVSSALVLPTNVKLATNLVPRFAKFKEYAVVVNTPSRPISVDVNGTVRVLTPAAPGSQIILSTGGAGTLSGTYLALQTYQIQDSLGNIIAESDYGPTMTNSFTVASANLKATFPVCPDAVSGTQLYRTATGPTASYFPWAFVPGNTTTTYEDSTSDAALGVIAGPLLGSAPDLTLIAEWGGRLWGVDRSDVDDLRFTEAGTMYGWSGLNSIPIPHIGQDAAGITALIPRRDVLGVARRDMFVGITGTDNTNYQNRPVFGGEGVGCVSQETAKVFNDVAYFLWRDGVYKWDSNGISSITNGKVRSWFTSDLYFNRSMFWRAFAEFDIFSLKYRLFLASVGSTYCDKWIEYDLSTGAWFGPHNTLAFTPTCALTVAGNNQQNYMMIGSQEGFISQDTDTRADWELQPINFQVTTKHHDVNEPDLDKYFGEVSVANEAQPTAGNLVVTPTVGELDTATPSTPFTTVDMTKSRTRLGRVGVGKQATISFVENTINQNVVIRGYEINPVSLIGRR